MNKVLLLAVGLSFYGCDNAARNSENPENTGAGGENINSENNAAESVQEGAGSEISPQLEGIEDSAARLKVDTINSVQEVQPTK
jgi:hypothetical protein